MLPLPALLRQMSVVVSRFSGASAEAAFFGVPAIFISEEARGQFSDLIDRGFAAVVEIEALNAAIAAMPAVRVRPPTTSAPVPEVGQTFARLMEMARDYSGLFETRPARRELPSTTRDITS